MESLYQKQEIRECEKGNMENIYSFCLAYLVHSTVLPFKLNFENLTANPKHSHFEISKRKSWIRSDLEALLHFISSPVFTTLFILWPNFKIGQS